MYLGQAKFVNCNKILGHVADQNYVAFIDTFTFENCLNDNHSKMPTVTIEKFRYFVQNCEVLNIFKVDMTFTLNEIDLKMILKALVQYKHTAEYVNYDILFI